MPETPQFNHDEILDGGKPSALTPQFDEKQHHAQTTSRIAYILLAITFLTVVAHYASLFVVYWLDRSAVGEALSEVFRVWIPLLSGFLGSALAYYFAQRER